MYDLPCTINLGQTRGEFSQKKKKKKKKQRQTFEVAPSLNNEHFIVMSCH
jgi:hypothetical protein